MKKIIFFYVLFLIAILFVSCESEIKMSDIVGKWCLISMESEINGESSLEQLYPAEDYVCYEFHNDSTYNLSDLGANECGLWTLRCDSLLGTLPSECEDDSANYTWFKIEYLSDTVLTMCNTMETDYGVVNERYVYHKVNF
jgi:hypothetical protein